MRSQMDAELGIDLPWWVWSLIAWAIVLALSAFSVDVGAKVLGVLMLIELASLVARLAGGLRPGRRPEGVELGASFAPANIFVGGSPAPAGIALAFAFASFIGFEATAIYGEESKDPKRSVPIATYLAVTIITLLFAADHLRRRDRRWARRTWSRRRPSARRSTACRWSTRRRCIFSVAREYVGGWLADADELAGAEQPVRRPARVPELRRPLLLLDGPRGRAASQRSTGSTRPARR